ncbi:Retrovirus-related Pol polyprotein from transposon 17.6 [Araneus ventricosus]|uniref:RNA-directed DNA polymerase n=1 Tax=Araneus ventricosus TaxID=182803 RepID=A0A4Y2W4R6_ARAVE|nr:Retrovirus-related Pol polyprotein from transposon 17.6 [Araneus ventricosus]
MLQSKKVKFKPKAVSLTLTVGTQNNVAAFTTVVDLKVEGKVVPTELIVLPEAKGNRTLLGTDFLQSAGIVLDIVNGKWHFCENPQIQSPFYKVPSKNENSKSISDSEKRSEETSSSVKVPETSSSVNLRSDEDDIIILSETFDQHINDLQIVFERFSLFKLHANREKCHFACDRVKYLSHWITTNGTDVDQGKVAAIQKIPVPTNVTEVQSFLETWSWFRRYVPNFANIARPLSNLTKKHLKWIWGPEQQEAFENLRKRLITPPVLKQSDGSKPFSIRTDASSYALGAVLTRGEGPEEHVIDYSSRLLIPAERNYCTTEREALAVVWALEKFRGYVENQEIIITSDHQPLK